MRWPWISRWVRSSWALKSQAATSRLTITMPAASNEVSALSPG